ncbi:type VI secretion lipoprotein TssJ [Colwellia sp. MB02u-10]|jgi:predicted component of type VI protein secretion system|uniref:type VI secretion lipoprotein TssJ n=1 Tax=Colwellia sp. MB02u-10 TaxID=2759828 RepID=UPI0015F56E84|nr:type VI secretion lipoprotein TssJ [Colwellia sp. MB02u-10]MBA6339748.1 type VI secretion lipoprotein TssJ [Colwellia sp. MB02u-10]
MNKFSLGLLIALALGVLGCESLPGDWNVTAEWNATIEEQPPISVDNAQLSNNDWIWQDKSNRWIYRESDEVENEYATWDFDPEAIVFRFSAPQQLNMHMGKPHSLFLKVYQLSNLKAFKGIAETPAGIRDLLSLEEIDTSIISTHELTISPNSADTLVIDRFKETRFIAIVTGYYQMKPEGSVRIFEIPSVANRYEALNMTLNDFIPFGSKELSEASRIKAWVNLGVTKIARLQMLAQ